MTFLALEFSEPSTLYTYTGEREVTLFGGKSTLDNEEDDPRVFSDRGLWFNGRNHYMTLENIRLPAAFEMRLWIRNHGDGALFSSSQLDAPAEKFISLMIDDSHLTLVDTEAGLFFMSSNPVKRFWWHYVQTVVNVDLSDAAPIGTTIRFSIDHYTE